MGRMSRIGSFAAAVAVIGFSAPPASGAAGSPTAHKERPVIFDLAQQGDRGCVVFVCSRRESCDDVGRETHIRDASLDPSTSRYNGPGNMCGSSIPEFDRSRTGTGR